MPTHDTPATRAPLFSPSVSDLAHPAYVARRSARALLASLLLAGCDTTTIEEAFEGYREGGGGHMMRDAAASIDAQAPGHSLDAASADATADASADADLSDACRACLDLRCRNYETLDVIAGCYEHISQHVTIAPQPDFHSRCAAAVACARRSGCGYGTGASVQASDCYCGSHDSNACQKLGPAADAPCRAEWEAALETRDLTSIQERFTDPNYPGGWAYHLVECERKECRNECRP